MIARKRMLGLAGKMVLYWGVIIEKVRASEFWNQKDNRKCVTERGTWEKDVTSVFYTSCLVGKVVLHMGVAIVKLEARGGRRWEVTPQGEWWKLGQAVEKGVLPTKTGWI